MRVIWKAALHPGENIITESVGCGPRAIAAGLDGVGIPSVWFTADPNPIHPPGRLDVHVAATGDAVPWPESRHIGTFSPEPGLIFHAFAAA